MRTVFILALLMFQLLPAKAHALSCAPPVINEHAVESAQAIFEGTVTEVKPEGVMRKIEGALSKNDMGKSGVFVFTVTKAWKGVREGDTVDIRRNTYWGDGFAEGTAYLVVAEAGEDGMLQAGLCGLTTRREHAETFLEFLTKHFGKAGAPE